MPGEMIRSEPMQPNRMEKNVHALKISMEAIADMDETVWQEELQKFRAEIDAALSERDLQTIETDLRASLNNDANWDQELRAAGARGVRRLILTAIASAGVAAEQFASFPFGNELFAAALTGFVVLTGRDLHSSYRLYQFRTSETGPARMRELSLLVREVAMRIDEKTKHTISI